LQLSPNESVLMTTHRPLVVIVPLALILLAHTAMPLDAAEESFGEQRSADGIRHSFLVTGSMTAIIDEESRISWSVPVRSRDGFVLPNGNVLVSTGKKAIEYTPEKKVVFEYTLSSANKELGTAVRLEGGNTLLVERGSQPRLLEVNASGKVVISIPLQPDSDNAHMQTRMARKLPSGNYIVPHLLAFAVKEYTPEGKVVRVIRTDLEELGGRKAENWPFTAILLDSGNLLVNLTHGNKTVEFDKEGRVAWRVDNSDVDGRFADPCGGQRLPTAIRSSAATANVRLKK